MTVSEKIYNAGFDEGRNEGELQTLFKLLKKGIINFKQAAEEMGMSVTTFKKELDKLSLDYSAFI